MTYPEFRRRPSEPSAAPDRLEGISFVLGPIKRLVRRARTRG